MPVTAKFQADFDSFYAAVQKADVSLKGFEQGAGKVESSLNKMTNSLSGTRLIQDATLMAEAVERVGGTSKLTADELAAVSAKASAAAEKLRAMGQDVPPGIAKIAAESRVAGSALDSMKSIAGSLAGAFGIAFSVGAVVNFGKSVFDSASQVHDMALKLGISAEAVQGFKFAATQAGSSLDAVGTAITRMNANLSEGDKGTVAALTQAGIKFQDIRNQKPEDAFLSIADAIQKIPDPMVQSEVALKLFGKSAAELLPAMKEGFRAAAEGADKMSNDTVDSLEKAQDAWGKLADSVVIATGTIIAHTISATKEVTSSWGAAAKFIEDSFKFGPAVAATLAEAAAAAKNAGKDILLPFDKAGGLGKTKEELEALEKAQQKAAAAARQHAQAIQDLADQFSGANAIRDAQLAVEALNRNMKAGVTIAEMDAAQTRALHKTVSDAIDAYARFGKTAPAALNDIFIHTMPIPEVTRGITSAIKDLGQEARVTIPTLYDLPKPVEITADELRHLGIQSSLTLQDLIPKAARQSTQGFGAMSQALAQLAQVSGSTFGGMVRDLSTVVASLDAATKSAQSLKDGMKDYKAGSTWQGILGIATGITGLVASAIQAGKAIANLFDRNKGRDLVVDFAETFGGFDQLHEKLLTLGDAGEALWIKLTQGVGRNNPGQAQAVIDEVTAALEDQADAQDTATSATEEQAKATIETASEAQKALDDLGIRIKTNEEEWAAWGAAVVGQISLVAASIRALPLPSATVGSLSQPTSDSGTLTFRAGGGTGPVDNRDVTIRVPVALDGRVVTEVVAQHLLG